MDRNTKLYQDFVKLYTSAYFSRGGLSCQVEANEIWKNRIKVGKEINKDNYDEEVERLKTKLKKNEESGSISKFFKKQVPKVVVVPNDTEEPKPADLEQAKVDVNDNVVGIEGIAGPSTRSPQTQPLPAPAQEKLKAEIAQTETLIANLIESRNLGFNEGTAVSLTNQIKEMKRQKENLEKDLKVKMSRQKASQKFRAKKREGEAMLRENYPEIAVTLKARSGEVGRPRIEVDQPGLLSDILKIATIGAACGEKRREDIFRTVKTLDDLHQEITNLGYQVSRSALYLRLEPRCRTTHQGKKHVQTVPVKLVRPQNNLRKGHSDRAFASESFKGVDKIAGHIGSHACLYVSRDDKSSVPLGVIAAKRQSSILMNLKARVRLPDHDFKVGSKHLLVPSVSAVCEIDPKSGVTYSGHTYIAIRSAKHNGSTAFSHYEDMVRFSELQPEAFKLPGSVNEFKPVLVAGVDGGPDENPRFHNNINMGCKTMLDFNLDCYIEVTNAPGLSAYNRAERRMYHLSKELTGVVLPYDTFGSHIVNGATVDTDLELKNFKAAGEVLAEIWNNLVIDNYPVFSEFISEPVKEATRSFQPSNAYRARHVLETQYMTVYLKCDDRSCCSVPKTNVDVFFPGRRIPPLIPIKLTSSGPVAMELSKDIHKKELVFPDIFARIVTEQSIMPSELKLKFGESVPYDVYLPTQQDNVQKRMCPHCKKYHASMKSLAIHKRVCKKSGVKRGRAARGKSLQLEAFLDDEVDGGEGWDEDGGVADAEELEVESAELNASFEDYEDNVNDVIEEIHVEQTLSVSTGGIFETILNLKDWMKQPWSLASEDL